VLERQTFFPSAALIEDPFGCDPDDEDSRFSRGLCANDIKILPAGEAPGAGRVAPPSTATAGSASVN